MPDLTTVPLVALSDATKQFLSTLLNPRKVIPSDDGLLRDWKGLSLLSGLEIPNLYLHSDPTGVILSKMQEKPHGFTIKDLQKLLERMDRWDIIDDTEHLMEKDATTYMERMERCRTMADPIDVDVDKDILTVDDLYRTARGLKEQRYDAFLLFADEDTDFAFEVDEYLGRKCGFKLCIKDRDLIGGVTFEHKAVLTLISERCKKLIVIVSPSFLKSSANNFFLTYAQALGIGKNQRKIIPCIYQECQLPIEINYYFFLDYNRRSKFCDFWKRLRDSINSPITESVDIVGTEMEIKEPMAENDDQNVSSPETNNECCDVSDQKIDSLHPKKNRSMVRQFKNFFKSKRVKDSGESVREIASIGLTNTCGLAPLSVT